MEKERRLIYSMLTLLLIMFASCTSSVPKQADKAGRQASTIPNYDGATLPPNIAPMNFFIDEEGERYVSRLYVRAGNYEYVAGGQTANIPSGKWRQLLEKAKGDTLYTDIYVRNNGKWTLYNTRRNPIAEEEADPYIVYRLIEPSYVCYERMTINVRDITNFKETILVDNTMLTEGENGACVNCHSFQNYNKTDRFQAHIRQNYGGTVLADKDNLKKVQLKTGQTLSAGVYPAWHPRLNIVAYSVNETGQSFHTRDRQKVEVTDFASDLILYDVEHNEVYDIDKKKHDFETFPAWSPDGKTLYYASVHYEQMTDNIDAELGINYEQLKYNLFCRSFNEETMKFGAQDTVFNASAMGKSAVLPRVSPDGRWLLFTMGDHGNFQVWHKSSDLWVMNLSSNVVYPLAEANSEESDSYHSWSSNGRWILFASRRNDGNYTRLYMAYFDKGGHAHHAFEVPQKDPLSGLRLFKSYNVPEWVVKPPVFTRNEFVSAARHDVIPAMYAGSALLVPEEEEEVSTPQDFVPGEKPSTQSSRIDY